MGPRYGLSALHQIIGRPKRAIEKPKQTTRGVPPFDLEIPRFAREGLQTILVVPPSRR